MEWPDARDLLVASGMTVTHRANKLIVRHDGAIDEIPVIGQTAMALFDGLHAGELFGHGSGNPKLKTMDARIFTDAPMFAART